MTTIVIARGRVVDGHLTMIEGTVADPDDLIRRLTQYRRVSLPLLERGDGQHPGLALIECSCGREHRTWRGVVKCRLGKAAIWISGDGPVALISWCGKGPTVTLLDTIEEAAHARSGLDRWRCGHDCWGASGHQLAEVR